MADTKPKIIQPEPGQAPEQGVQKRFPFWQRLALGGIILISAFMNFFQLGQNGFGRYYSAAVRSMMDNWHNFFFASYDPGGFVTIDKPPVGFWLQVASAKLFGFTPFSVLVPQALAGVLSVALLYSLVRHRFGVVAGLLAALALALSPISVVANRNITIDSTLVLVLLLGAWAVLRAAETGQLRWLLLSAALVGLGFNIKMLEAYLVVPAFGLLYLLAAPRSLWKRVGHLAVAGVLLLVVSFSWAAAVDLTPASQRPYVGSTQNNSEMSLALGYNGIYRLTRGFSRRPPANTSTNVTNRSGRSENTGAPGPLRLFNEPLGGQIAWLLPLALFGMLALAWQRRPRLQSDPGVSMQQQSLVLWGMWLLTMGIFFSMAGFSHLYFLMVIAPAIAALFGIGLVTMWQDYRCGGWRGCLLPLALVATVAEQVHILTSYPVWGQWMIPLLVVLCVLAVGGFLSARIAPRIGVKVPSARSLLAVLSVGVLALLLAPTVWAAIPVIQKNPVQATSRAIAGPSQRNGTGFNFTGSRDENAGADPALVRYLEAHQGNATFLVATLSSYNDEPSPSMADRIILATNKPMMAMGGYRGNDPILTTSKLASLVAKGTVRFFLLGTGPQRGHSVGTPTTLTTWVRQHCTPVPAKLWQSASTRSSTGRGFSPFGANQLYDCVPTH